jgi:16S rRNA (adenine1518-N6/adenine1519-N6)-dimethyltransferase
MSLEEVKSLLSAHQIIPNKLLGQNFMTDSSIFPRLSEYSELTDKDTVLDAGAGFGFLTLFLANKCKRVLAIEKDKRVAQVLRERVRAFNNITVLEADVLKAEIPFFNKVISIPPYYLSSQLVVWLLDQVFDSAVLIVQKEFAKRLVTPVGSEGYGWLSVVSCQHAKVELLDAVPKWMFYPEPEVNSIIIKLRPLSNEPFSVKNQALFLRLTKWLFTQRNKKLANALAPFIRSELKIEKAEAERISCSNPWKDRRVRELAPETFGEIADSLVK